MFKMAQPFPVDDLFTQVRVYKGRLADRLTTEEIVKRQQDRNFANVGQVQDAVKLARNEARVFVVGAPGAGKTTFLKYMVLNALNGYLDEPNESRQSKKRNRQKQPPQPWLNRLELQRMCVPLMLVLNEWWEQRSTYRTLEAFVENEWLIATEHDPNALDLLRQLLVDGKMLILFDGLDEISKVNDQRDEAVQQIELFMRDHSRNRFMLSCRTGATDYHFSSSRFTHIEIADFDNKQITNFVKKWFRGNAKQGNAFLDILSQNARLMDLARTPLLIALMSALYEQRNKVYLQRVAVYEEALSLLLETWDATRNIKRAEIYRGLDLPRKHKLFASFAYKTFEKEQFIFKTEHLAGDVGRFILNMLEDEHVNAGQPLDQGVFGQSPNGLGMDVLNAIEEQHGIVIKRVEGWHAFAHLTFHEYYAARFIAESGGTNEYQLLLEHSHDDRWREVILMTAARLTESQAVEFINVWRTTLNRWTQESPTLQRLFTPPLSSNDVNSVFALFHRAVRLCLMLSLNHKLDLENTVFEIKFMVERKH
jgi:predicted NACHT family NTPase